jgi:sigma-B regulation protein RsbU (phosphoserine phosphatase)
VGARKAAQKALNENTELAKAKSELQQHAEKIEEQVQQVNRQNQELKQFSHVVTHNLKEPLRKILLYSNKLQTEKSTPEMDRLLRSAAQMKSVVYGLQEYVWLNEKLNRFTEVHLNEVVRKAAEQLGKEIDADILQLQCEPLHTITGDEEQLQLMFYHLLQNAVKFRRGDKAQVHISSTILKQNTFRHVQGKYNYEDFVRVEVRDEGTGFDPAYSEHIFELFRKLHSTAGQGLGLALCRKIVQNHGGFIEADSRLHAYTRIMAWLPLHQPATEEKGFYNSFL